MKMVGFSEHCARDADGVAQWGEVGSPIIGSRFVRDYCYICNEPIRVPREQISYPNACSFCQPAYRGSPGVSEAERLFWIRQNLEENEVISG